MFFIREIVTIASLAKWFVKYLSILTSIDFCRHVYEIR